MKKCYVLETSEQGGLSVFRSLKRLVSSIGRPKQYQTFRRILQKDDEIIIGDYSIRNAEYIASTRK